MFHKAEVSWLLLLVVFVAGVSHLSKARRAALQGSLADLPSSYLSSKLDFKAHCSLPHDFIRAQLHIFFIKIYLSTATVANNIISRSWMRFFMCEFVCICVCKMKITGNVFLYVLLYSDVSIEFFCYYCNCFYIFVSIAWCKKEKKIMQNSHSTMLKEIC